MCVKRWAIMDICRITVILLLLQQLQHTSATIIDPTTEYTMLSKSTANKRAEHHIKSKIQTATMPTTMTSTILTTKDRRNSNTADADDTTPRQQLVALSSKSYISAPTTHATLKTKRADIKPKKAFKDMRNHSHVSVERNKLQQELTDHVPDPSSYVSHRIGHPGHPGHPGHFPPPPPPSPPEYSSSGTDSDLISSGMGGYHATPYEGNKWHEEYWERNYEKQYSYNGTRVQHIEAECQDDYMKIRIGFNGSFSGLLYSAGYAYDPDCMYINGSGRDYYEFYIQLNRCGTLGKNALQEENRKNPTNFMWNTVTVQYNPLIEEEYDEHFKVTCEYGYDFWKTVTFPFLDVEVATGNPVVFTLSPPECYMEIQNGYGIGGPRVTGPVRVGDPLTLIIYMRSKYDGFDIVVNDCYAHNGANKRIQLIDQQGCPVDDKLISRFRGSWSEIGIYETQVYAYMKTFRFTGSPALYIECDVRMCHGRCPSQPCHWRNLKAITKRDTSNLTAPRLPTLPYATVADTVESITEVPLSENVNLFQSLRVLQEGEADGDDVFARKHIAPPAGHQTCLKTSTFSALTATFSGTLCILSLSLFIACSRLKHRKEGSLYDSYITHKGQID